MKQDWDDICGAAYNPAAVTDEPKIHGVTVAGEVHPPIGLKGVQRDILSGYPY